MLWPIEHFEFVRRTLDFSSSGQSKVNVRALYADNKELFNAVELLEYEAGCLQSQVCEQCGITHCQPGNWVSLRRLESMVLICPATKLLREEKDNPDEYEVPRIIRKHGIPIASREDYISIQNEVSVFPPFDKLPRCDNSDFIGLLQLVAPGRILGKVGERPSLDSEGIVAVSDGDLEEEVVVLNQLLSDAWLHPEACSFGKPEHIRTLYTDLRGFPEWSPYGYNEGAAILNSGLFTRSRI